MWMQIITPALPTSQGNESVFVHWKVRVIPGSATEGRVGKAIPRNCKPWGNDLTALGKQLRKGQKTKESASCFWEKQKAKTKSERGLLEVGSSLPVSPFSTALYRTTSSFPTLTWSAASCGLAVFLNLGCLLESPRELLKIPGPTPHPRPMKPDFPVLGPRC